MSVSITVKGLDTDVSSRNDKMINDILSMSHFPEIQARIQDKVILSEGQQTIHMVFNVKEKSDQVSKV